MKMDEFCVRKVIRAAVPTFEPVTLAEAKDHLRLAPSSVDHDSYVLRLIKESREEFEADSNVICATGSYTMKLNDWPAGDFIELPVRPVSSITSIVYTALDGTTPTWSIAEYSLYQHETMPRVYYRYGYSFPTNRGSFGDITITFVAGYSATTSIPESVRQAVLVNLARRFEMRGDIAEKNTSDISYQGIMARHLRQTYP